MEITVKVGDTVISVPDSGTDYERLVRSYLPLALKIAKRYNADHQYLADIRAAAIEGLSVACKRLLENGSVPQSVPAYIGAYVNSACLCALREKFTVVIAHQAFWDHYNDTGEIPVIETETLGDHDVPDNPYSHDQLEGLIKDLKLSNIELDVLKLRLNDLTMREIAEVMGICHQYVAQIIEHIQIKARKVLL